MLAELRHWVEDFARKQYPAYMARLRPCWPNHPEAVWELSTLMAEWERVYGDADNRDLAGALWWHERWLPGVIARLDKAITCDEAGCRRLSEEAVVTAARAAGLPGCHRPAGLLRPLPRAPRARRNLTKFERLRDAPNRAALGDVSVGSRENGVNTGHTTQEGARHAALRS